MELTKVSINKFKKVTDVVLDLADLNVLVGVNASGKSSILQAIHIMSCILRQAGAIRPDKPNPVSISELDYLPTNDYKKLGNWGDWGTITGTSSSKVSFGFEQSGQSTIEAYGEIRQARNIGISLRGKLPDPVKGFFRGKGRFFSAYIPGISGIPNEEQKLSKRVVLKACSFGDANVYLRNALDLLVPEDIEQIESWLEKLIGKVSIYVNHSNDKDLTISASVSVGRRMNPIELLGMGYLQLIQIFCYLLLFKPKVLLIDEPDIHLHPDVQEKLPKVLDEVAKEQNLKILLTTHSPFIVRGLPNDSNVFWMEDGAIEDSNRQEVELALGWGAFGKKIILFSEDKDTKLLKHIISQWPDVERITAVHPGIGFSSLPDPDQARVLVATLGKKYELVVHRDRDFMTDSEVKMLESQYGKAGVHLWVTDGYDIESYFCETTFLCNFLDWKQSKVENMLSSVIANTNKVDNQDFKSQRSSIYSKLHKDKGDPPSHQEAWEEIQSRTLKATKGKKVFQQLAETVPKGKLSKAKILNSPLDGKVADNLYKLLKKIA